MPGNTVQITFSVKDDGTIAIDKMAQKINTSTTQMSKDFGDAGKYSVSSLGAIQTALNLLSASAVVQLARTVSSLVESAHNFEMLGARALAVAQSYEKITSASGIMGEKLVQDIHRASNVFVDDTNTMIKAQQLLIEKFTPEQIEKIAEFARLLEQKAAIPYEEAWNRVTGAILTGFTRGIREAFPMDSFQVFDRYARSIGSVSDKLTEGGKQQAVYGEMFRMLISYYEKYGPLADTEYEKLQRQVSAWNAIKSATAEAIVNLDLWIAKTTGREDTSQRLVDTYTSALQKIGLLNKQVQVGGATGTWAAAGKSPADQNRKDLLDYDKIKREQTSIDLDYQAKYLNLLNERVGALQAERAKAVKETQDKGLATYAIEKFYNEAIKREGETLDIARKTAIAGSVSEQANLLGNINLIQQAEQAVFDLKMRELKLTKEYTPELEKQMRDTFALQESEKKRAAEAEYYKYPQYEVPPDDWEKAGKKAAEERRKAVIDLAQQYAQLTGDLEGQMQASRDLDALKIAEINREQGGDEKLIKLTKELGELTRQQIALDYQKTAIDIKSQTANLAGDWDKVKSAESGALEVERQSLLLKYSANKAMQDQVNLLYNMKQAEVEAQRTMNVPALVDIGSRKALIQANQDLANQYENLIPNAINTMTDAIKNSDGSFKNFFDNASKGFLKMAQDIASGILKKEMLTLLVDILPEPLKKFVQPEQKAITIKPEGDALPVKIINWPGLTDQGVPLKAPEAVSAAQGTVGGTESGIAGAEAAIANTTNVAEKVGGATGLGEITQATSVLRSIASMVRSVPKLINDISKGISGLTSTIPGITETSLPLLSVVGEGGGGLEGLGSIMGEFFKYGGTLRNVRTFQGGGIVNQPTVAIFGEGTQSEAFIPLNQGKIPLEMSTIRSFQDRANLEAFVPLASGKIPVEMKNMQSTLERLIATETTRIQSATKNIQGFQEGSAVGSVRRSEVSHPPDLFFRAGGIIENIRAFQEGGVVSEPTLALFGEGNQDEAFVPLRGGKIPVEGAGGTHSYTIYHTSIYANDAASFEDMVNRNPGAILKVIHKDSKFNRSGIMRNIVKRG